MKKSKQTKTQEFPRNLGEDGHGYYTKPLIVPVAQDPAVMTIARMVVASVDEKYSIHPNYRAWLKQYGKENAQAIIRTYSRIPGACDIIQTDMLYKGVVGLSGGLASNSSRFIFYEWGGGKNGQLKLSLTKQEARDIVSGKKKTVIFKPVQYKIRICIDTYNYERYEKRHADFKQRKPLLYTKDTTSYWLPEEELYQLSIGGKQYEFDIEETYRPHPVSQFPAMDGRIHIVLTPLPEVRSEVRAILPALKAWKRRSRKGLDIW